MAQKELYVFGAGQVQMSDISPDGTVGKIWEAFADTLQDSGTLTAEDDTTTNFEVEEKDSPVLTLSQKGVYNLNWSIIDTTPGRLVLILGGSIDENGDYCAPIGTPNIEKSVRFIPKQGSAFVATRVKLRGAINWSYGKQGLLQVDIQGQLLSPEANEEPPYRLVNLSAIRSLTIAGVAGIIDKAAKSVTVTLPNGTDVTSLAPEITLADGVTITPESGVEQDFTNEKIYTVKVCTGVEQKWTVFVNVAPVPEG